MNCHTIGGCLLHTFVDKHAWGSGGGGAAMHARENVGERAAGTSIMYALHVCRYRNKPTKRRRVASS